MRSRSAAIELTLLVVLVMALLLSSLTWLTMHWQSAWMLNEVQRGLSLASDTLQSSLRDSMMHNRRDQIVDAIERVSRDTGIRKIRILNHRGQVMLSTAPDGLRDRLGVTAPECNICHEDARDPTVVRSLAVGTRTILEGSTLRAFTPILAEQGCVTAACHRQDAKSGVLGVIDLGFSMSEVQEILARNRLRMISAFLGAIIVGGVLLWLAMAIRFRRPMGDVLRGIDSLSNGDLRYRIPIRTNDEFGQLAKSFNTMSRQLATMQEKLIQSERLISMGKLAGGVAHEINNPLTGILSYAEDLAEDAEPSDPRRKDYEVIVREALRCRQIVRSLLDFARQDEPRPVRSHPRVLIEKALDVVIRQASFRNIRFVRDMEEDLPAIEVDPLQIEQVIVNLVVNAQQAMPRGGKIIVGARASRDRRHVEFYVRDNGVGIPAELRAQIFEPFFSTKGGKTSGLGLSICLGIVQRHGGTIRLESETGQETTFAFTLPVVRDKEVLE